MGKHILSALVENKSGVLAHLSGLFSARGFNIDSLAVGETEDPQFSRMTIVVAGDEAILEQVSMFLAGFKSHVACHGKPVALDDIGDWTAPMLNPNPYPEGFFT